MPPFPGLEPDTVYGQALTNKRIGYDAVPGPPRHERRRHPGPLQRRTSAMPGCLTGIGWYYGFDANHGKQHRPRDGAPARVRPRPQLPAFANVSTGGASRPDDVFGKRILDLTTGKTWHQMTNAERVASAINTRKVVWNGAGVTAAVPGVLAPGTPLLRVNAPAGIAGDLLQSAPPPSARRSRAPGVTGNVVQALDPADGARPTTFDACSPLTNAAAVAGNIALVDRGTCTFVVKVKNAQNAGAIGGDRRRTTPRAARRRVSAGVDPTITIPSVPITQADGNTLKAASRRGRQRDAPARPRRCGPAPTRREAARSSTRPTPCSSGPRSRTGTRARSRTSSWSPTSTAT